MINDSASEYNISFILVNQALILRALSFLVANISSESGRFSDEIYKRAEETASLAHTIGGFTEAYHDKPSSKVD
jgi:hypothetical protein